jgi:N-acetylmuramoyl-L-alanine amidase
MLKYKIYVLFLFILTLGSINYINANNNSLPLFGKVIYIDPGHGGLDPGAMYNGIKEKDINLEISKKLENKLTSMGAIVYLTRYDDYDLSANNTINRKRSDLSRRGNAINKSDCDIFLSIHLNAEDSSTWRGAQVFYDDTNEKNEEIAKIFQEQFKKDLKSTRNYKKVDELYLQRRIERPGVLLEVGFLSNSNDRYLLKQDSYQNRIVTSITSGLLKYFSA